ncbi:MULTISPECIES: aspartate 1-decarboxylase [Chitinophagaceae]|uniref:aspartate 1-decarboxylase n=1 Tax=Chitinophagaceae TaxID=563835 RepID=UPI000DEF232A|nr:MULTISPECIES: aspartate 1-decarboxylase [Chitinophagaceae]RPD46047.1 aspartate 1-decarboxylase [Paracnuella aquatica]
MQIQLLRTKVQQLVVSESSENYPGSIALPDELIEASGLRLFELVHVNNLTNGNRIVTYVVRSKREGFVTLNGAASKLFSKGDKIHVLAYGYFDEAEAVGFEPRIIYADEMNRLKEVKTYSFQ